jgi:hypothetical protein
MALCRLRLSSKVTVNIEYVGFVENDSEKGIKITIRNIGKAQITVDRIYIAEDTYTYPTGINIEPLKSHTEYRKYNWEDDTKYTITIGTTAGLTVEKTKKSPLRIK